MSKPGEFSGGSEMGRIRQNLIQVHGLDAFDYGVDPDAGTVDGLELGKEAAIRQAFSRRFAASHDGLTPGYSLPSVVQAVEEHLRGLKNYESEPEP